MRVFSIGLTVASLVAGALLPLLLLGCHHVQLDVESAAGERRAEGDDPRSRSAVYDVKLGLVSPGTAVASPGLVVTGVADRGFFAQVDPERDGWDAELGAEHSGIFVFTGATGATPDLHHLLDIESAVVEDFYGQSQLVDTIWTSHGPRAAPLIPTPVEVTAVLAGASASPFESVLVALHDVEVTDDVPAPGPGDSGAGEVELRGGLRLDDYLGCRFTPAPEVGERFSELVGVVVWRNNLLKVAPRSGADITRGGALDAGGSDSGLDGGVEDGGVEDGGDVDSGAPMACGAPYLALDGLEGEDLLAALFELVESCHQPVGYYRAREHLFGTNGGIGLDRSGEQVTCLYTGERLAYGYNTEHLWPQSDFDGYHPMRSDLHHLYASDEQFNSRRGNYRFGTVASDDPDLWFWPYWCDCAADDPHACCSSLGGSADPAAGVVFEPRDSVKGDIARALFYFAVRYRHETINLVRRSGVGPAPHNRIPLTEESVLRRWHQADPVSAAERARNDAIESVQGNRNPFVDCPALLERLADL